MTPLRITPTLKAYHSTCGKEMDWTSVAVVNPLLPSDGVEDLPREDLCDDFGSLRLWFGQYSSKTC